jgi:cytochrome c peroxidase
MKKTLLIVVAVLVGVGLLMPLSNLLVAAPAGTALGKGTSDDRQLLAAAAVLERKCAYCHVSGTPRPFYAKLPLASSMIEGDVKAGLRAMDLAAELFPADGGPASEPALAKIERELKTGEMPPAEFLLLHWTGGFNAEQQSTVLSWIKEVRIKRHAPAGIPAEVAAGVIHPLPAKVEVDPRKAALGNKLYHDKRLSGDDTISCATCHDLGKGGTDQDKVSTGIRGQKGGINAPTTLNSGLQFRQFWDGRAATLEDQADGPPNNPVEMGSSWEQICKKLDGDQAFADELRASYPDGCNKKNATDAIAAFERTLLTPGSRFDKHLLGDGNALSAEEKRGYQMFLDTGCATCHAGKLLGGGSFELIARFGDYFKDRGTPLTDADNGRFNVTKSEADRQKFKVPTLRNVAKTFPYMHDGSVADLNAAVRIMAHYTSGEDLSEADRAAVAKFLESLTGELGGKGL